MIHEVTIEREDLHLVAACSCGKRYEAPNEDTALKRWEGHLRIENARAALEEGRTRGA